MITLLGPGDQRKRKARVSDQSDGGKAKHVSGRCGECDVSALWTPNGDGNRKNVHAKSTCAPSRQQNIHKAKTSLVEGE